MGVQVMAPKRVIVLVCRPFLFESGDTVREKIRQIAESSGFLDYTWVDRLSAKTVPSDSILISDRLERFGSSPTEILNLLSVCLKKQTAILIPNLLDTRFSAPYRDISLPLLRAFVDLPIQLKSIKIKEGIALSRMKGKRHGRTPISEKDKEKAIVAFKKTESIRGTVRILKETGTNISRASLQTILRKEGLR